MSEYSGESIGKKLARLEFWKKVAVWLGPRFFTEKFLVLASEEGGDISVLTGLGVRPGQIVACDLRAGAVADCETKYPGVRVVHGDVAEVASKCGLQFAAALLDFCGHPTDSALKTVARVGARAIKDRGVLAHAFMIGREQRVLTTGFRNEAEDQLDSTSQELAKTGRTSGAERSLLVRPDGRNRYVYRKLKALLEPARVSPIPLWALYYHSSCAWRHGVPMGIYGMLINRHVRGQSLGAYHRQFAQFGEEWSRVAAEILGADMSSSDGAAVHVQWGANVYEGPMARQWTSAATVGDLVAAADAHAASHAGKEHMLLNVNPRSLAAWRAHRTRGTYAA